MYKHALVAMKALPFHLGHEFVIQTAISHAEKVTVFLVHHEGQTPDGPTRAGWIRDTYPDVEVVEVQDIFTNDDDPESSIVWARYTRQLGYNPDLIVSSEDYGARWATALDADHIAADPKRTAFPISATMIRENPFQYFAYINMFAQPHYVKKVLIVGAESTGKTTLAQTLAAHYRTVMVPEYGRIYSERAAENREGMHKLDEFLIFPHILERQPELEDTMLEHANGVMFCDTDLYVTALWLKRWQPLHCDSQFGFTLLHAAAKRLPTYDLILVMDPNTPFVDDGYREFNVQKERDTFTNHLCRFYDFRMAPYVNLTGTWEERTAQAKDEVDKLLKVC